MWIILVLVLFYHFQCFYCFSVHQTKLANLISKRKILNRTKHLEEDKIVEVPSPPLQSKLPIVSIIGRPNTGKSTLVNRIAKSFNDGCIVHDEAGITRDRTYKLASWEGYNFQVVDTGGLVFDEKEEVFAKSILHQANIALNESHSAVLVCDAKDGPTDLDLSVAKYLRRNVKIPVIVAINKCDAVPEADHADLATKFKRLRFGMPAMVSAIHDKGIEELVDIVTRGHNMTKVDAILPENVTNVAIIGRPNVGKSSLLNRLYGEERVIVSDVAGTTRDAVDVLVNRKNTTYRIVDTAGIRRKSRIDYGAEFFMINRAFKAIRRADIVVLLLDATQGIVDQDRKLAERISEEGRACLIALNKWDAVPDKSENSYIEATDVIRRELNSLRWANVILISALHGQRTEKLFDSIDKSVMQFRRRISTSVLNQVVNDAVMYMKPPMIGSKGGRIYFASQVRTAPPTFVFFVNDKALFPDTYIRYLEKRIRESLSFEGAPIKMEFKSKTLRQIRRDPAVMNASKGKDKVDIGVKSKLKGRLRKFKKFKK